MNIIIDFDFASRHTAPSQLDVIFHVKQSGPQQISERISEGLAFHQGSERRKSIFRGGTCRYRHNPLEILAFCHDIAGLSPLFCTVRYLRRVAAIVPVQ